MKRLAIFSNLVKYPQILISISEPVIFSMKTVLEDEVTNFFLDNTMRGSSA